MEFSNSLKDDLKLKGNGDVDTSCRKEWADEQLRSLIIDEWFETSCSQSRAVGSTPYFGII